MDKLAHWTEHLTRLEAKDPETGSLGIARRALAAAQLVSERYGVGPSAALSAADRVGEVGRLARRYQRGSDPTTFVLSSSVRGVNQVTVDHMGP